MATSGKRIRDLPVTVERPNCSKYAGNRETRLRLARVPPLVSNTSMAATSWSQLAVQVDALLVNNDPFFNSRRVHLVTLATYHRLPTIYPYRECVEAGGLMSYGSNLADLVHQVGVYCGRILKGERPADLRSCERPSLSSSSTCKRPKRSGLLSRRLCSPEPTR
jgi:hypothetical protein